MSYVYDADNNRTQVTDKRGNATHYAYDDRGNTTTITDALNARAALHLRHDAGRNNLLSETDPRGHTTTYEYDAHSNLTQRTDALSHVTTWTYDGYGQLVSTTDAGQPHDDLRLRRLRLPDDASPTRWATPRASPTTPPAAS